MVLEEYRWSEIRVASTGSWPPPSQGYCCWSLDAGGLKRPRQKPSQSSEQQRRVYRRDRRERLRCSGYESSSASSLESSTQEGRGKSPILGGRTRVWPNSCQDWHRQLGAPLVAAPPTRSRETPEAAKRGLTGLTATTPLPTWTRRQFEAPSPPARLQPHLFLFFLSDVPVERPRRHNTRSRSNQDY